MISSVFKTKKLVFVRKGTLFMTAETEAIKAQILSTGNAEILLEENDFLIVKWIKPEIKYSMAAYQYGKTGMANNYHPNSRGNCIGERNITAEPPYIELYSTYAHTKILFNKKGLFRKNKNMIDFHNLQRHINEFGYTTLDLS